MKNVINEALLIKAQRNIIQKGFASGSSLLIGDENGVLFENHEGVYDAQTNDAVRPDTLYHIYSMTKLFTVVAALTLVDQGKLRFDDPVYKFFSEYKTLSVYDGAGAKKANGIMTVKQLFTMTSGLSYFQSTPRGLDILSEAIGDGAVKNTADFVRAVSAVPLEFEPGERFRYGLSHDVLGGVIQEASGMSLADYFKKYIYDIAGLENTYFYQDVPESEKGRLAKNTELKNGTYVNKPLINRPVPLLGKELPRVYSGGSGLVCTAADYGKLLSVLMKNGGGVISRNAYRVMTSPQLTGGQRAYYNVPEYDRSSFGEEHTFGAGVRVQDKEGGNITGHKGEWGWSGALGSWYFVSPYTGRWFVYMHQHSPAEHGKYITELRNAFYNTEVK